MVVGSTVVVVGTVVVGHAFEMVSPLSQTPPGGEHVDGLVQLSDSVEIAESTVERCAFNVVLLRKI